MRKLIKETLSAGAFLAARCLASCGPLTTAQWQVRPAAAPLDPAAESDACEAVFRFLIHRNDAAEKSPKVLFLQDRDGDPSAEILARFAWNRPPVKPVSASQIDPRRGAVDRSTGEIGLIFRIDELQPEVDGGVTARAGYYEGDLSAAGYLFKVARRLDRWTIIRQAPLWIS